MLLHQVTPQGMRKDRRPPRHAAQPRDDLVAASDDCSDLAVTVAVKTSVIKIGAAHDDQPVVGDQQLGVHVYLLRHRLAVQPRVVAQAEELAAERKQMGWEKQ